MLNMKIPLSLVLTLFLAFFGQMTFASDSNPSAKVLMIADNHMSKSTMELIKSFAKDKGIDFSYLRYSEVTKDKAAEIFSAYNLVLFDALNQRIAQMLFPKFSDGIKANPEVMFEPVRMPAGSVYRQGISDDQALAIKNYYHNGGRFNFINLMAYISHEVFGAKQFSYQPFKEFPENGFYHYKLNDLVAVDKQALKEAVDVGNGKPSIAVAMHRGALETEQTKVVDKIIKALEAQGVNAFGYFFDKSLVQTEGGQSNSLYLDLLIDPVTKQSWIDVIINNRMIHFMDKRKADFNALNVPVIHTLAYNDGDQAAYENDHAGLSATMAPYFLMMPETSGIIDPTILTSQNPESEEQEIIDYQLNALAERAVLQAKLAGKANRDKKVAIMIWNYPPGEKNIGAAFLNVPKSLVQMTNDLIDVGFTAEKKSEEYYIKNAGGLLKPLYRTGYKEALKQQNLTGY